MTLSPQLLVATLLAAPTAADQTAPQIDPSSGMIVDTHWETVRMMCSSCHSPKLFTNYGATRETWAGLIDWMQEKQGLWPIPPKTEKEILDYLAKNYPPGQPSRRSQLPAHLRPPNPYLSETRREYEEKLEQGKIVKPKISR